jgi:hypothetical protein
LEVEGTPTSRPATDAARRWLSEKVEQEVLAGQGLRRGAGHGPGHGQGVEVDLDRHVRVGPVLVEAEELPPGLEVELERRARVGDPVQPAPDPARLVADAAPVLRIEVAVGGVVLVGEVDGLAAAVEDVVQDLVPARRAAPAGHDPALDVAELDGRVLRQADQVVGDDGVVGPVHRDAPAAVARHVVGPAARALGRPPDDVVVDHVGLMGGLEIDAAAERLEVVAQDVPGYPRVRVLVVEPDGLRVDRVADDVSAEERVLGQVELDAAGLPGQLDVAAADVLDQVGFDEGALDAHAGDAAHPGLVDVVAADDGVPDRRRRVHVPILGADVEGDAVGVAQDATSMIQWWPRLRDTMPRWGGGKALAPCSKVRPLTRM